MDRRTLLKSSGAILGGLTLSGLINRVQAATPVKAAEISFPTEQHPLLLNFNENSLGMSVQAKQLSLIHI